MKRDSGALIATVGAIVLAVACCVGVPLIAATAAAIGIGALLGGFGGLVFVAIAAIVALTLRWRQRV